MDPISPSNETVRNGSLGDQSAQHNIVVKRSWAEKDGSVLDGSPYTVGLMAFRFLPG